MALTRKIQKKLKRFPTKKSKFQPIQKKTVQRKRPAGPKKNRPVD